MYLQRQRTSQPVASRNPLLLSPATGMPSDASPSCPRLTYMQLPYIFRICGASSTGGAYECVQSPSSAVAVRHALPSTARLSAHQQG